MEQSQETGVPKLKNVRDEVLNPRDASAIKMRVAKRMAMRHEINRRLDAERAEAKEQISKMSVRDRLRKLVRP